MEEYYPAPEDLIRENKISIEKIKIKKADKHEIMSYSRIKDILNVCKGKGDVYDEAGCLLKEIIQKHPFASGNRRTAFVTAKTFLEKNNLKINVENSGKQAKVLQGIREGYYDDKEIVDWIKTGKIRLFERK